MDDDQIEAKIQKQTGIALTKLNEFKINKVHLKRPVFFVPGWCDESCTWWIGPKENLQGIAQWVNQIADNPEQAIYINFNDESVQCNSFLDFGEFLKNNIWAKIGKNQPFDLVGYSMSGLDIRAALIQGEPLLNCQNCITADTPHQGDNFGGLLNAIEKYAPHLATKIDNVTPSQAAQAKNMDPNYQPIQLINILQNRQLFLSRVNKLLQFKGTRDWVVMDSGFMVTDDIGETYNQKVGSVQVEGCEHVGPKGITLDVRAILAIFYMLLGIEIPSASNQGIFPGGVYTPPDENEIFIG